MSKYGVISGSYFPVFGLNTAKYGPEITLYLDTFHAVYVITILTKVPSGMPDWVQNISLQVDTTQHLKFKR